VSHGLSEGCLKTSVLQLNQAQYYQHYNIRDTNLVIHHRSDQYCSNHVIFTLQDTHLAMWLHTYW